MRKEYRKALRAAAKEGLASLAPAFAPVKVSSPVLWGGESVFRSVPCTGLHTYIIVVPSPTGHQTFTLELGWSTGLRFPAVTARPSIISADGGVSALEEAEAIIRIGDVAGGTDLWWSLPDPAMERPGDLKALQKSLEPIAPAQADADMAPRVMEALDLLERHGLPFFEAVARRYCGPPRPVGVVVREFTPADRQACLAVFMSNVPRYFTPQERHEFEAFLDALPGPYLVLIDHAGEVVGCGGYAVNEDGLVADLCWGMVGQGLHGTGLGRMLTESRMDRVWADERVREIALNTSQHTTGFYEHMGFRTVEVVKDGYAPGLDRCEMRCPVDGEVPGPAGLEGGKDER